MASVANTRRPNHCVKEPLSFVKRYHLQSTTLMSLVIQIAQVKEAFALLRRQLSVEYLGSVYSPHKLN